MSHLQYGNWLHTNRLLLTLILYLERLCMARLTSSHSKVYARRRAGQLAYMLLQERA
jgi:hypothetical protein